MINKKMLMLIIVCLFTLSIVTMTLTNYIVDSKVDTYEKVILKDLEIMEDMQQCNGYTGTLLDIQDSLFSMYGLDILTS